MSGLIGGSFYKYPEGLAVSVGIFDNTGVFYMSGYNPDIDTGAEETIWPVGGSWTPMAYGTITAVSSSVNDTAAGSGARTLEIIHLDTDGVATTSTLDMDGTTPVVSVFSTNGINKVKVIQKNAGGGSNAGNITITATVGGSTQAYIATGDSKSRQLIFNVPSTGQYYIKRVRVNTETTTNGVFVKMSQRINGITYNELYSPTGGDGHFDSELAFPFPLIPNAKVWFGIVTEEASNIFADGFIELVSVTS